VSTDSQITGRLARFGRGGMIEEISATLLAEFAVNLQAMLSGGEADATLPADPEPPVAEPEPEPISPVGPLTVRRVRENPSPVVALLFGFLIALRVLRRRP
jgi:hypothetical protein